jgi:hypothetical protein
VREQFVPLVTKAAHQFLNEQVNDRLKSALGGPDAYVSVSKDAVEPVLDDESAESVGDIVTTEEEIERNCQDLWMKIF